MKKAWLRLLNCHIDVSGLDDISIRQRVKRYFGKIRSETLTEGSEENEAEPGDKNSTEGNEENEVGAGSHSFSLFPLFPSVSP